MLFLSCRAYVEDLLEGDKKFLIFAHHQDMMDALCEACDTKVLLYHFNHYIISTPILTIATD